MQKTGQPIRVCFVCLGNICRSPTAEGVFQQLIETEGLGEHVEIDSAGTSGWHEGERADPRSRTAAAARGVDLRSRARKFEPTDFDRFDYVLVMDLANRASLIELASDASQAEKVRMFRSFDDQAGHDAEVPDPYHGGEQGFEDVLDMCERASAGFLAYLRRAGSLP